MFSYFFGKQEADAKEHEDPVQAMKDQLDNHGNFEVMEDGCMAINDLIVLRCVVYRQALRKYQPLKVKHSAAGQELLKAHEEREYVKNFLEMHGLYSTTLGEMAKKACEHLEFKYENFQMSMKQAT